MLLLFLLVFVVMAVSRLVVMSFVFVVPLVVLLVVIVRLVVAIAQVIAVVVRLCVTSPILVIFLLIRWVLVHLSSIVVVVVVLIVVLPLPGLVGHRNYGLWLTFPNVLPMGFHSCVLFSRHLGDIMSFRRTIALAIRHVQLIPLFVVSVWLFTREFLNGLRWLKRTIFRDVFMNNHDLPLGLFWEKGDHWWPFWGFLHSFLCFLALDTILFDLSLLKIILEFILFLFLLHNVRLFGNAFRRMLTLLCHRNSFLFRLANVLHEQILLLLICFLLRSLPQIFEEQGEVINMPIIKAFFNLESVFLRADVSVVVVIVLLADRAKCVSRVRPRETLYVK